VNRNSLSPNVTLELVMYVWLMRCRRLVTRYEAKAENFVSVLRLACARLLWKRL
jgi:transposase